MTLPCSFLFYKFWEIMNFCLGWTVEWIKIVTNSSHFFKLLTCPKEAKFSADPSTSQGEFQEMRINILKGKRLSCCLFYFLNCTNLQMIEILTLFNVNSVISEVLWKTELIAAPQICFCSSDIFNVAAIDFWRLVLNSVELWWTEDLPIYSTPTRLAVPLNS